MASTRSTLERFDHHLDESMGVRRPAATEVQHRPPLSPVPSPKDVGRRPLRGYGTISVEEVIPDPNQPRAEFTEESLQRLADSIREKGQLSPIRVRWSETDQSWIIISGERRWRAAKVAALKKIACYFQETDLTPSDVLEQQLIENLLREDLQPIEEARAFADLMGIKGWNGKQLAAALHVAPAKVSRALALLKLPADVQQRVDSGQLSARAAYEISKLDGDDARRSVAQQTVSNGRSHIETAKTVRQRRGRPKPAPRGTRLSFPAENGWNVVVSASRKGNYFEVEEALRLALEEVQLRIKNNVQIL